MKSENKMWSPVTTNNFRIIWLILIVDIMTVTTYELFRRGTQFLQEKQIKMFISWASKRLIIRS